MPDSTFDMLSLNDFRKLTPEEQQAYITALRTHVEDMHAPAHALRRRRHEEEEAHALTPGTHRSRMNQQLGEGL